MVYTVFSSLCSAFRFLISSLSASAFFANAFPADSKFDNKLCKFVDCVSLATLSPYNPFVSS